VAQRTVLAVFWGHAPRPPGSASPRFGPCSFLAQQGSSFAELRFLLLFLEKEESGSTNCIGCFLGARPQTPWVGFAEVWAVFVSGTAGKQPRRATLFASFSGKRSKWLNELYWLFSGGTPPDPLGRLRRGLSRVRFWHSREAASQSYAFCFFF
jgi:hypothetical protein